MCFWFSSISLIFEQLGCPRSQTWWTPSPDLSSAVVFMYPTACLFDIQACLSGTSNITCLKLNSLSSISLLHPQPSFGGCSILPAACAKNLEVILDFSLFQIPHLVISGKLIVFYRWNVARTLSLLIPSTANTLVQDFIVSCLDCGSCLLTVLLPSGLAPL